MVLTIRIGYCRPIPAGVLERKLDARGAPWIYNTWEPFERSINRATTLQLIDVAGFMGMDIFTIDDGWQQEYGENTVDPTAFPGGLDAIQKAVEAKGMRLGLWIPLAAIGQKTADYVNHPDWAALDQAGKAETYFHHGWFQGGDVFGEPFPGRSGRPGERRH